VRYLMRLGISVTPVSGITATPASVGLSRSTLERGGKADIAEGPSRGHEPTYAVQQIWSLLDHLIGCDLKTQRYLEAEPLAVLRLMTISNLVGC
jgi:hypothetical protein